MTQFTTLATKSFQIEDNGMKYDVEIEVLRNNTDGHVFPSPEVFKVRKDGSRGLRLKSHRARLQSLVIAEADAFAAQHK